jgi:endonuclease G
MELSAAGRPLVGTRIANARGTPGTLGCFGLTLDDRQPVMLTSHHVLFGAGGLEQEPVWLVEGASATPVGRTRHGKRGAVRHGGADFHVDCATAGFEGLRQGVTLVPESAGSVPSVGAIVHKVGAATGATRGVVADTNYSETVSIEGRSVSTLGQILVRAENPAAPFSAAGDSGAALRNEDGAVIGLIWGRSTNGGALACPIAPVLWVLHVQLARVAESGTR